MSVNSLQRKKPSEQMAEYVAGRNRVNVMPQQYGSRSMNAQRPVSQGQARAAEIARQNRQQEAGVPVAPKTPAEIVGYQQAQRQQAPTSTPRMGGTVLTQEQVLANNINDIIKRMNEIMSQPGQLLSPSASPYYNIYMEQYRKNAEAAEANAFARSVASTGGYGSSYATMAGQQAYRDTMEGFAEMTPTLTQTKGQAMSDLMTQYQLAKGLKEELDTEAEATGVNSYTRADGTTVQVDDAKVQGAYDYIASALQGGGSIEQVENTIREGLRNQRTADGEAYTEDEINAAIDRYKGVENAAVADVQKNTAAIVDKGLNRSSDLNTDDLATLGIDATAWGGMDEGTQKATLLDAVGQARKDGKLSAEKYMEVLEDDVNETLKAIKSGDVKKKASTLADLALDLEGYKESGYMTESEYLDLIDAMTNNVDMESILLSQKYEISTDIHGKPSLFRSSMSERAELTTEQEHMIEDMLARKKVNQIAGKAAKGVASKGK